MSDLTKIVKFGDKLYIIESVPTHKNSIIEDNYLKLINHFNDWHILSPKGVATITNNDIEIDW